MDLDELSSERIQQLEALVTEYKGTVQELQRELDERGTDGAVKGGTAALQRLQEELEAERTSNASLQAGASPSPPPHPTPSPIHPLTHPPHTALEAASQASTAHEAQIEQLEQTLFELRGEIGAGRHVPPGVRVLSLRENPAQAWADASQAAVERLRRENEALMRRLQELEDAGVRAEKGKGKAGEGKEGEGGEGAMVPRESWEVVNREKARLEEELKQKEKRLKRLQEVRPRPLPSTRPRFTPHSRTVSPQIFQSKSAEFREAVASILGVKLAFYPNGQVRVTSHFDLNAAFVFQPTHSNAGGEGMRMQLVAQGDGGPEDLPQLMRYWVEQEQCIPGFLASVTLECYEKHKMEAERERGQR